MTTTVRTESTIEQLTGPLDEKRWDRGAWLTLALGILLFIWALTTNLFSFNYPTDGWMSSQADSTFAKGGQYSLIFNLAGTPSELQSGDVITAINDKPLLPDALPPIPTGLRFGDTVRYTINRSGEMLTIDAPLQRLDAAVFGRLLLHNRVSNLQIFLLFGLSIFIFLARPGNLGARYLFIAFAGTVSGIMNEASYSLYRVTFPPVLNLQMDLLSVAWAWLFFPSLTLFILAYPVRQWPLRRFPRLSPILLYSMFLLMAAIPIALTIHYGKPSGQAFSNIALFLLMAIFFLATIGSFAYNLLRVKNPIVRAQLRWLGLGFVVGLAIPAGLATIIDIFDIHSHLLVAIDSASSILLFLLPLSLAVGILRYRLFDIDVIIRRTTSYAIITGLLGLVYFGSIIIFERVLTPLIGQSDVAVVLSTLLIAALFLPIRRRVQDVIDRRFNRTRYNAEKTIEAFAATVRNEPDLDALTAELLRVIQQTMEPESLSIMLFDRDAEEWRRKRARDMETADH